MPWASASLRASQAAIACRIVGILLFITAFFLPAVSPAVPGYDCAWITLLAGVAWLIHSQNDPQGSLVLLAGLTNVFVIGYLAAITWGRKRLRTIVAIAAVVGLASAIIIVLQASSDDPETHALAGHYLWVAGILLILAPELNRGPDTTVHSCA